MGSPSSSRSSPSVVISSNDPVSTATARPCLPCAAGTAALPRLCHHPPGGGGPRRVMAIMECGAASVASAAAPAASACPTGRVASAAVPATAAPRAPAPPSSRRPTAAPPRDRDQHDENEPKDHQNVHVPSPVHHCVPAGPLSAIRSVRGGIPHRGARPTRLEELQSFGGRARSATAADLRHVRSTPLRQGGGAALSERARQLRRAQVQAPMPWILASLLAVAICSAFVARSARGAYLRPPAAFQLDWVNCNPP